MRINIFMLYSPFVRLTGEGIGRHTAKIFEGLIKLNADVCIVAPYWLRHPLKELLRDEGVHYQAKNIKFSKVGNPIFYIIYLTALSPPKKSLDRYDANSTRKIIGTLRYAFGITMEFLLNYTASGFMNILLTLPILIVGGLIAAPFALIALLLSIPQRIVGNKKITAKKVLRKLPLLDAADKFVKRATRSIFDRLYSYEARSFVNFAKKQNCDMWYAPAAFWEDFNDLPQPRAMCVPDLSPIQFAGSYIKDAANASIAKEGVDAIKRAIDHCDLLFTYNHTAFSASVSSAINVREKRIYEVNHAAMHLNDEICVMNTDVSSHEAMEFAKSRVKNALFSEAVKNPYLSKFTFEGTDTIVYPTRVRPNKNIMNLVKAVEYLVRVKRRSIKLVLTDDYTIDENLNDYVKAKRLQYEILSIGRQTPQTIAALYKCATLAVSSARFEGGLPFTVTEAISVDTPVVITRNAVSRAAIPDNLDGDMCFDADDYRDMAKKIEWALDNRALLLKRQKDGLAHLLNRSWQDVAQEYLHAFENIIETSDTNELKRRDEIRKEQAKKEKIARRRLLTGIQ